MLVMQVQAVTPEVPREPAGLNEQLFAQMLQAQQAAAGGESSGAEPGSTDKLGSAADSKKKVPVMLKGARLAFSRPGIVSGRQPGPNRPSPGSQVCTLSCHCHHYCQPVMSPHSLDLIHRLPNILIYSNASRPPCPG